eukprot:TRINITY_DN27514_c0_g1_i1.p1 TRINITY_DN27514_c0_g1~~TRINITY_DN27514_c0_g1_i1.p1  ORF type:complete len:324 (-),score=42.75 TRINITY_DN27514_c0_g1_i1:121-1092(-)
MSASMSMTPGPARSAGRALMTRATSHPTLRMDGFLRASDPGYQHGEAPSTGNHFVRRMASCGSVRPSACFTNESRAARGEDKNLAFEASRLPPSWNDPRGDAREGTFALVPPPKEDSSFMKMIDNQALMMPSERYKEHMALKAGMEKFKRDRAEQCLYYKRLKVLEKHHPNGIVGVDGPLFEGTRLYEHRRAQLLSEAEANERHAVNRYNHLGDQRDTDETVSCERYGEPHGMERSRDICIQRKRADPELHPHRYLSTHGRLFPEPQESTWDTQRAANIRAHDVRDRRHDIITGQDTSNFEIKKVQLTRPAEGSDPYSQSMSQ